MGNFTKIQKDIERIEELLERIKPRLETMRKINKNKDYKRSMVEDDTLIEIKMKCDHNWKNIGVVDISGLGFDFYQIWKCSKCKICYKELLEFKGDLK